MTDQRSLAEILKSSDAYKSLRAEQIVASYLLRLGWRTRRSPYYLDAKSEKLRELDVAAFGSWKKPLKAGDLVARVNLFIEVKSNSEYHILCAGPIREKIAFESYECWIGYSKETRTKIEELLSKFTLKREEVLKFLHYMERITFPKSTMRISKLRVEPPPVKHCFSAFRETNGKIDKELDNSVLWRAALALRSAVASAQVGKIDGLAAELSTDLEVAWRLRLPFKSATGTIDLHARTIDLYLPVVVIQSRIWSAETADPEELRWARLVQFGIFNSARFWVDVVNFDHLEEYLCMQMEHYERAFRRARAKRSV